MTGTMISNLRLSGIIVGLLGLAATFLIYRGPKWKRANFVLLSLGSLSLVAISIDPNLVNFARDMLALQKAQHGRILALLIISNVFLFFYSLSNRWKLETIRIQMDRLIRNLGATDFGKEHGLENKTKPIMVVIPAYNEAGNLRELLPRMPAQIQGANVGVLVVDDGSEDGTKQVALECGAMVVSNPINRGQGAASRLGYDILQKYDVRAGVTMDADNQHRPEDLERVVAPILNGNCDLVIGSRVLGSQEKASRIRWLGVSILSRVINLITGLCITDCASGYKAFNMKKLRDLKLTEDQFQSSEVLIEACKKGLTIGEVPIAIHARKHGKSKKGTDWSYGFYFAKTILKTWWR